MWYERRAGLRFECTQCGACCTRPGIVAFTPIDMARIGAHLGMSAEDFRDAYLHFDGELWVTEIPEGGGECVFLGADARCTIHEVKPWQCDAYPFWFEIVCDEPSWLEEGKFCEGIGRGALTSPEEIQRRLDEDPLMDDL